MHVGADLNAKGFLKRVWPTLQARGMLSIYTGVRNADTPPRGYDIVPPDKGRARAGTAAAGAATTADAKGDDEREQPDRIGGVNRSRALFLNDARLYKAIRASTIVYALVVYYYY
eukprot:SAG31_NODE_4384_length_3274_cov_23.439837_2_plen_115_part_00